MINICLHQLCILMPYMLVTTIMLMIPGAKFPNYIASYVNVSFNSNMWPLFLFFFSQAQRYKKLLKMQWSQQIWVTFDHKYLLHYYLKIFGSCQLFFLPWAHKFIPLYMMQNAVFFFFFFFFFFYNKYVPSWCFTPTRKQS